MDKTKAAQFLNVSTRTLQRYTTQGKISVTYRHGKTGAEADYDEVELQRFKETLESTTYQPANGNTSQAIAPTQQQNLARIEGAERLAAALEALKTTAQPRVLIENKLLLKLDEASALTGLSRATLRNAIEQKKLKAQIIGRAWRIKRNELESYIQKL
jgi:excisionase family DNA binding protein